MTNYIHYDLSNDLNNGNFVAQNYISSSGSQYIDTGVIADNSISVELKFKLNATTSNETDIFGADISPYPVIGTLSSKFRFRVTSGFQDNSLDVNTAENTIFWSTRSIVLIGKNGIRTVRVSGDAGIYSLDQKTFYLFAANTSNGANYFSNVRIYYCKMYKNGELIRDFIPVKNVTTNEYGMYDLVTKTFYGNLGSGSFTGVNAAVKSSINFIGYTAPNGYIRLAGIVSNGQQFIDLGVNFAQTTDYPIKCEFECSVTGTGNQPVGGCGNSSWAEPVMLNFYNNGLEFGTGEYYHAGSYSSGVKYRYVFYTTNTPSNRQYWLQNGSLVATRTHDPVYNSNNFYLFRMNNSYFSGCLFYFKLYKRNPTSQELVLVRDLIPVMQNSTGKIGMYDTINNVFYENQGTSSFTPYEEIDTKRIELGNGNLDGFYVLDYIESDGNQYIDTGVVPNAGIKISGRFSHNEHTIDTPLFGVRKSDYTASYTFWTHPMESSASWVPQMLYSGTTISFSKSYYEKDIVDFSYSSSKMVLNGVTKKYASGSTPVSARSSLILFGLKTGTSIDSRRFAGKLYSFKIWDSDGSTLVRDFIPVRRKYDLAVGLYDLVTNVFYASSGSGAFTAGPYICGAVNEAIGISNTSGYGQILYQNSSTISKGDSTNNTATFSNAAYNSEATLTNVSVYNDWNSFSYTYNIFSSVGIYNYSNYPLWTMSTIGDKFSLPMGIDFQGDYTYKVATTTANKTYSIYYGSDFLTELNQAMTAANYSLISCTCYGGKYNSSGGQSGTFSITIDSSGSKTGELNGATSIGGIQYNDFGIFFYDADGSEQEIYGSVPSTIFKASPVLDHELGAYTEVGNKVTKGLSNSTGRVAKTFSGTLSIDYSNNDTQYYDIEFLTRPKWSWVCTVRSATLNSSSISYNDTTKKATVTYSATVPARTSGSISAAVIGLHVGIYT